MPERALVAQRRVLGVHPLDLLRHRACRKVTNKVTKGQSGTVQVRKWQSCKVAKLQSRKVTKADLLRHRACRQVGQYK